ncbi:MAG: ROK family protein [Planctomycetes bacterium]|nr:ROK family protein [Planctomycetota bacterium]
MTKFAIGIDLGGSHITAALVDQNGHIKARKKVSFSKAPNGKQGIRLIAQLVNQVIRHSSFVIRHSVRGVGLACPGSIDAERGIILADSPNLIGWKGTKVKQELEKALKIPVFIDNDANLAGWGEKCWGAGKKATNLICLTLGTGVGGGIIIDNQIYRGSHFYAAEIGHMNVDPNGPDCSCGKPGHLEALVSAPAIVERYALCVGRYALGVRTQDVGRKTHDITAKTIFDKARKGDKLAREVVQDTAHYLGLACASLINIFDPEMVVIGGGVAQAGEILFKPLRQVVKASIMKHPYRKPLIVPAKLGEDAGLLGAAALALSSGGT